MIETRGPGSGVRGGPGFTLLEVIVTLALVALILGVSTVALASLRPPAGSVTHRALQAARDSAIRLGRPVALTVSLPGPSSDRSPLPAPFLFLPDGRGIGAGVDPLTGVLRAGR